MSEARPSLFARLFRHLNPRLTGGLITSSIFLFLVALSNLFSVYAAAVETDMQALPLRVFAVLLYALPAVGILRMNRWARLLGIFLCCVASLLGILTFLSSSVLEDMLDGAFIILTHGAVLFCLLSRKTRAAFTLQ